MSGLNDGSDGLGWKDVGGQEVIAGEVQGGIEGGELLSALEAGIAEYREEDVILKRVGNLIGTNRGEVFNLQGVGHEATIGECRYGDAFMEAVRNNGEPVLVTAVEIERLATEYATMQILH